MYLHYKTYHYYRRNMWFLFIYSIENRLWMQVIVRNFMAGGSNARFSFTYCSYTTYMYGFRFSYIFKSRARQKKLKRSFLWAHAVVHHRSTKDKTIYNAYFWDTHSNQTHIFGTLARAVDAQNVMKNGFLAKKKDENEIVSIRTMKKWNYMVYGYRYK